MESTITVMPSDPDHRPDPCEMVRVVEKFRQKCQPREDCPIRISDQNLVTLLFIEICGPHRVSHRQLRVVYKGTVKFSCKFCENELIFFRSLKVILRVKTIISLKKP